MYCYRKLHSYHMKALLTYKPYRKLHSYQMEALLTRKHFTKLYTILFIAVSSCSPVYQAISSRLESKLSGLTTCNFNACFSSNFLSTDLWCTGWNQFHWVPYTFSFLFVEYCLCFPIYATSILFVHVALSWCCLLYFNVIVVQDLVTSTFSFVQCYLQSTAVGSILQHTVIYHTILLVNCTTTFICPVPALYTTYLFSFM